MMSLDFANKMEAPNFAERRLVNSQYLAETMQHLAENSTFRLRRGFDRFRVLPTGSFRHVRFLILDWYSYPDYAATDVKEMFPRLRRLELEINSSQIPLFQTDERPQEATIRAMPLVVALSEIHDLQEFELRDLIGHGAGCLGGASVSCDERRLRLHMLRSVLRQMVTRPLGIEEELTRNSATVRRMTRARND